MRRLDRLLLERGLVESREKAQSLIMAGLVYVDGKRVDKAGYRVKGNERVEVLQLPRYVSRGGDKLESALRRFRVDVKGKVALDVGSSTGGFTDCLLRYGAIRVYAVDVGRGQMHPKLRNDPRVVLHERTDARTLTEEHVPEKVDLLTVDVSFISLTRILPSVLPFLKEEGDALLLVKPQFELTPKEVRKGIVRDRALRRKALLKVVNFVEERGYVLSGVVKAFPRGAKGNEEFFLWITSNGSGVDPEEAVENALNEEISSAKLTHSGET